MTALTLCAAAAVVMWVGVLLDPRRAWVPLRDGDKGPAPGADAPLVSVIIPARNEEATIKEALGAHFRSAWPNLEVVLVDDGSTDDTRECARAAAASAHARFTRIDAGPLPPGWVGKVNAMAAGVRAARGRYILFTDADIVHAPDALCALVAESEAQGLGLNSRMALLAADAFWEKMLVPAFVHFFALLYPFRAVSNARSRTAAAAGGCMLVLREALERAGGLAALKDAIIDDVALACAIKRAGFPLRLTLTRKLRSLRRYTRLAEFWHTVTRTAFTELRYSYLRLAVATLALCLSFVAPAAALGAGLATGNPLAAALGGSALFLSCAPYAPMVRYYRVPLLYALTLPATAALYLGMTWHSALRYALGSRSRWKGRDYARG
jgi:hopene-associated glycosyltransferase HpnB